MQVYREQAALNNCMMVQWEKGERPLRPRLCECRQTPMWTVYESNLEHFCLQCECTVLLFRQLWAPASAGEIGETVHTTAFAPVLPPSQLYEEKKSYKILTIVCKQHTVCKISWPSGRMFCALLKPGWILLALIAQLTNLTMKHDGGSFMH